MRLDKRKCAALAAVFAILAFSYLLPTKGAGGDIDGHWSKGLITRWRNQGLIVGSGDGNFHPDEPISRAEIIALVNRMMGYTEEADISSYEDVPENAWYRSDIAKAVSAGYISAPDAAAFFPDAPVTRQEAIAITVKVAGYDLRDVDMRAFEELADKEEVSPWAESYLAAALNNGLLVIDGEGCIYPQSAITRAQAVALLDMANPSYVGP